MGKLVLATITISGSAKWLLKVGGNKEKWYGSDRIFMYVMTVFGAMTVNYSEQCTEYGWVVSNLRLLAGCLLAGGLLSAAYMDRRNCWVYNYVWWWCLPWTGILLGLPVSEAYMEDGVCRITDRFSIQQAAAVALFVLLQQILFAQMYGRADCHAFSVCALAGCAWQGNLLWFLIHMLSALTLLAAVQFCRRNVTPDGKLRVPKPFIPYIVVTFWVQIPVMLYLQSGSVYIYA
mgnify:FL=1